MAHYSLNQDIHTWITEMILLAADMARAHWLDS